jgi:hypothetical protein
MTNKVSVAADNTLSFIINLYDLCVNEFDKLQKEVDDWVHINSFTDKPFQSWVNNMQSLIGVLKAIYYGDTIEDFFKKDHLMERKLMPGKGEITELIKKRGGKHMKYFVKLSCYQMQLWEIQYSSGKNKISPAISLKFDEVNTNLDDLLKKICNYLIEFQCKHKAKLFKLAPGFIDKVTFHTAGYEFSLVMTEDSTRRNISVNTSKNCGRIISLAKNCYKNVPKDIYEKQILDTNISLGYEDKENRVNNANKRKNNIVSPADTQIISGLSFQHKSFKAVGLTPIHSPQLTVDSTPIQQSNNSCGQKIPVEEALETEISATEDMGPKKKSEEASKKLVSFATENQEEEIESPTTSIADAAAMLSNISLPLSNRVVPPLTQSTNTETIQLTFSNGGSDTGVSYKSMSSAQDTVSTNANLSFPLPELEYQRHDISGQYTDTEEYTMDDFHALLNNYTNVAKQSDFAEKGNNYIIDNTKDLVQVGAKLHVLSTQLQKNIDRNIENALMWFIYSYMCKLINDRTNLSYKEFIVILSEVGKFLSFYIICFINFVYFIF